MRVLPINNFNSIIGVKKNGKLENPKSETVQYADSVSFKANYDTVFTEVLRKKITTYADFKDVFAMLTNAVRKIPHVLISKKIKQYSPENFFSARSYYDEVLDFSKNMEEVLFKTAAGTPLLTVSRETIDFYPTNNNYKPNACEPYEGDYIRFGREDDTTLCFSKPLREITIWWPSGNLKEDISYVDHSGRISHHKYYKKDGTPDGWKNFFLGS